MKKYIANYNDKKFSTDLILERQMFKHYIVQFLI